MIYCQSVRECIRLNFHHLECEKSLELEGCWVGKYLRIFGSVLLDGLFLFLDDSTNHSVFIATQYFVVLAQNVSPFMGQHIIEHSLCDAVSKSDLVLVFQRKMILICLL